MQGCSTRCPWSATPTARGSAGHQSCAPMAGRGHGQMVASTRRAPWGRGPSPSEPQPPPGPLPPAPSCCQNASHEGCGNPRRPVLLGCKDAFTVSNHIARWQSHPWVTCDLIVTGSMLSRCTELYTTGYSRREFTQASAIAGMVLQEHCEGCWERFS